VYEAVRLPHQHFSWAGIDQIALTEVLRARRIAGAALDVLEQEPPSPGDPILKLDNVIVLPHIGTADGGDAASDAGLRD
jgi:phosphoglycerate dehydrogenase-like enzyme